MSLLYINEHFGCYNYDRGVKSLIELRNFTKGEKWAVHSTISKILCVTKGKLTSLSQRLEPRFSLLVNQMFLIPAGSNWTIAAEEDSTILVFRLRGQIHLCDSFPIEKLLSVMAEDEEIESDYLPDESCLHVNSVMDMYMLFLSDRLNDGLKCRNFFEAKIEELFFLLRAYYTKDNLFYFFYPLLSNDTFFSDVILQNWKQMKGLKELAELTNYSISGFEKRFRKVFKMAPYQWLNEQKAEQVLQDLNHSDKTLKEISSEYGFNSNSHLNNFCKSKFGLTPGQLRKENKGVNY